MGTFIRAAFLSGFMTITQCRTGSGKNGVRRSGVTKVDRVRQLVRNGGSLAEFEPYIGPLAAIEREC